MKWNRLVVTRFSDQDYERMRQLATRRGLTMTSFVRSVVIEALEKEEQTQQGDHA